MTKETLGVRPLPSADTGSDTEKREKGTGSALEGLEGEGFCLDPLSEILVMTAPWRLTEEGCEGSVFKQVCQWAPGDPRPHGSSILLIPHTISEAGARLQIQTHIFH